MARQSCISPLIICYVSIISSLVKFFSFQSLSLVALSRKLALRQQWCPTCTSQKISKKLYSNYTNLPQLEPAPPPGLPSGASCSKNPISSSFPFEPNLCASPPSPPVESPTMTKPTRFGRTTPTMAIEERQRRSSKSGLAHFSLQMSTKSGWMMMTTAMDECRCRL